MRIIRLRHPRINRLKQRVRRFEIVSHKTNRISHITMVIGNTLDETAYHEAGHITIAAAVGLDLQHRGIVVYEVGNVGDGWAFYWEDNQQWKDILKVATGRTSRTVKEVSRFIFFGCRNRL